MIIKISDYCHHIYRLRIELTFYLVPKPPHPLHYKYKFQAWMLFYFFFDAW